MRNLLLWIASIALIAFQVPYANATTFYTGATCLSYCGLNLTLDTTYEGGGEYLVTSITATVPVTVLAPGSVENPLCLLYTSPSPRDGATSRMPSSA